MKSKVYCVRVSQADTVAQIQHKLSGLLEKSQVLQVVGNQGTAAVKLHFGEESNTGFVKPDFVKIVCEKIKALGSSAFLSDTNTLYRGRRTNSADHRALAYEHGFTPQAVGVEVIIPDDTQEGMAHAVAVNGKFVKTAKIARLFSDADSLVGIAHFKGHIMTGFGGALKNLGMGCATREGKLVQHGDVAPFVVTRKCIGCFVCRSACPADAIGTRNKKAVIMESRCIGCATCIAVCPEKAIDVPWEAGGSHIQEKMVEFAEAVLSTKRGTAAFLNFATKITKECDCLAKDDPRICPDVGIFASTDPVAIDKACFDVIVKICGTDIFRKAHPQRNGLRQLEYAAKRGLGSMEYDLVEVEV